jgi:hypothetical protein
VTSNGRAGGGGGGGSAILINGVPLVVAGGGGGGSIRNVGATPTPPPRYQYNGSRETNNSAGSATAAAGQNATNTSRIVASLNRGITDPPTWVNFATITTNGSLGAVDNTPGTAPDPVLVKGPGWSNTLSYFGFADGFTGTANAPATGGNGGNAGGLAPSFPILGNYEVYGGGGGGGYAGGAGGSTVGLGDYQNVGANNSSFLMNVGLAGGAGSSYYGPTGGAYFVDWNAFVAGGSYNGGYTAANPDGSTASAAGNGSVSITWNDCRF